MAAKRRIRACFLKHGRWWIAWTEDVPGALTQGRTLDEARENLRDAVLLMREPFDPLPTPTTASVLTETLTL